MSFSVALEEQDVTVGSRRVESATEHLIKMVFELTSAQTMGDVTTESVWAEQVEANAFKIMNTPFHVTGLSFLDVVSARPLPAPERLFGFDRVLRKSGRSTYRLFVYPETTLVDFLSAWKRFEALGCSYEQAKGALSALYAIDVPATADIGQVQGLLREGFEKNLWDVEEADCATPMPPLARAAVPGTDSANG